MTPEGKIKKAFVDTAKSVELDYINLVDTGVRGIPDKLVLVEGGCPVFVEFKAGKQGRLSRHQIRRIQDLRDLGYQVEVIDNIEDAIAYAHVWGR